MEFGENREQGSTNSSSTILGWDVWELNINNNNSGGFYGSGAAAQQSALYGGGDHHVHPDPHLVCLKLGKRHYFDDHVAAAMAAAAEEERRAGPVGAAVEKRGRGGEGGGMYGGGGSPAARCQVEGCHVALVNAKEYHRRHKVCEMHSKAPKVVVLGLEQRFCQQCSRFHVVSEFEETKRSCKRRLAGHNQRRRKSSHDSIARNSSLNENKLVMMGAGFPYMMSSPSPPPPPPPTTTTKCALSLLSSRNDHWAPQNPDLSSRSSAALRELIAENRAAAILTRQLVFESKDNWHQHHQQPAAEYLGTGTSSMESSQGQMFPEHDWERVNEGGPGAHVTLDLMHAPSHAFGFVPEARARAKAKTEEGDCCDHLWNSF